MTSTLLIILERLLFAKRAPSCSAHYGAKRIADLHIVHVLLMTVRLTPLVIPTAPALDESAAVTRCGSEERTVKHRPLGRTAYIRYQYRIRELRLIRQQQLCCLVPRWKRIAQLIFKELSCPFGFPTHVALDTHIRNKGPIIRLEPGEIRRWSNEYTSNVLNLLKRDRVRPEWVQ